MAAGELANMGGFLLGLIPTLIAEVKGRPRTRWYLYGAACALVALPLVMLPTIHALFLRQRNGMSEQLSRKRRRADALALLGEDSVQSYPSWIAELSDKSPARVDRRRYAYEHLGAGEALELVREHTDTKSDHAVSYYHRAVHLGYVPKQHHWIAEALDDGLRLTVIVENLKTSGIFRRRAKSIGTRIVVLSR